MRLKKVTNNKSPPFTMKKLDKVLSKLKTGKAEDPSGWVKEHLY